MRVGSLNRAVVVCVGAFVLAGFAGAGAPAEESAQVDALFAAVTGSAGPGAAVLVVRDGKIVHEKGYGMANLEHAVPNTPQTKFRIVSLTKAFTAMAVMILHERGVLNIDDVIG